MGFWGTGIFENDDAADFAYDIVAGGWPLIRRTLIQATPRRGWPEALVCAELCAHALGQGRFDSYDREIAKFLRRHGTRPARKLALIAMERIMTLAQSVQDWATPESARQYMVGLLHLQRRLQTGLRRHRGAR